MAIVGTMGLIGLAINDSIVVLDALTKDQRSQDGDPTGIRDVVIESTRHIISTTLTTIGGFLPLILFGGTFWPPLAIAIAGGLVGATLLALVFVPAVYAYVSRRRRETIQTGSASLPPVVAEIDVQPEPAPKRRLGLAAGFTVFAGLVGTAAYLGYSDRRSTAPDAPSASPAILPSSAAPVEMVSPPAPPGDGIERLSQKSSVLPIEHINSANKAFLSAETLLRQGEIDAARRIIQTGLKMSPDDERLLGLERALDYEE